MSFHGVFICGAQTSHLTKSAAPPAPIEGDSVYLVGRVAAGRFVSGKALQVLAGQRLPFLSELGTEVTSFQRFTPSAALDVLHDLPCGTSGLGHRRHPRRVGQAALP